ncbi:glycosyltransferase [Morganella psychrotolerans]|uniref:WalM protein n=1 Tax=Morganella psychrotolerans TaxID=368603 RepID=A0A1B8HSY1_9GAMM|nr:glycosyltransferase [Morganella psychrotolerans]OBU12744.1 WalM protein [Morganella psychrotolerans]
MKIAYIDPYPVPAYRVASLQIVQMIDAMARRGCSVEMVSPQSSVSADTILGRAIDARVSFTGLKNIRKTWFFPFNSQKVFNYQVSAWLKKNPVDAVFTRNLKMAYYLLNKHPGIPCFFESHEVFSQSFRESHDLSGIKNQRKLAKLLKTESIVYRDASAVFVKTALIKVDAQALYKTDTPVYITSNGVDLLAAGAVTGTVNSKQKDAKTNLLYLGSLHPWKGLPTIIHALPALENVTLNVAGGKPEQIAELKVLAETLEVADRICFMGYVEPVKRFQVIADADICVLPLTDSSMGGRYTSPLKLFEYMAMKKPVVISDLPSIRSITGDDMVNFAKSGDAASFAGTIRRIIDEPANAARKTDCAFSFILEKFNWDKCADETLNLISNSLSAK